MQLLHKISSTQNTEFAYHTNPPRCHRSHLRPSTLTLTPSTPDFPDSWAWPC
jgi:hypothetical protein